ncbi:MAG: ubiquinol-cytochrome c reductase iron-sulfur subunit [Bryobacteraceae bacterium]|nr:ubiquinol-cytochrome c reductase iron-sulfur subunit [Bryobacteraceae bacterium]
MKAGTDRRTFHLSVIYGLWGLITGALALPAAVYLLWPPRRRRTAEWVEAADIGQLALKSPEEVVFRRNRADGWKITSEKETAWVVKLAEDQVIAFAPQCTHLGCAYHWDERKNYFLCPCHTSAFSLEGKVLTGPAPRPLDRFDVKVENGKLLIGPAAAKKA